MKLTASTLALVVTAFLPAHAGETIGVRDIALTAPMRGADIGATVWYPAAPGGTPVLVGDNGVFAGAEANRDAPVLKGKHPVILLSHGGFRAAPNADSWIAAYLAREGFVVASVHPPSRGLTAHKAMREFQLRPADLTATLSALEQSVDFADALDKNRIGALGFLLGGTTALVLGGAEIDSQRLAKFCDDQPENSDCRWFAESGVDIAAADNNQVGGSFSDPRIGSVVAIAPEFSNALAPESISDLAVPVRIISLGSAIEDYDWGPTVTVYAVADALFFDVFNDCKDGAERILRDEGSDERLCAKSGQPRAEIHDQLAAAISLAFREHLHVDN